MTLKILLITLLLCTNSLFAQNNEKSPVVDISIGLTHAPPLIILENDNAPAGMLVDFLKSIALLENWNINWVVGSWSDVLMMAEKGDIDVMTYIAYTEERAKVFNFSNERFVTGWGQIYSFKNESINNIFDLDNKKIAVIRDDIHAKRFSKLCQEYSINCIFTIANDYDKAFNLLIEHEVSAALSGSTVGISYEKKLNVIRTPVMFNPSNALFAASKTINSEPLTIIDRYLSKWRNDPDSPYTKSKIKWMSSIQKNDIPQWVLYMGFTILALFIISVAITLLLRSQIKKHVQQHIKHSNQLKQIINLVPHMIYVVNSKAEVVLVNKYASKYFGVTLLANTQKHQLLQKVPQYRDLFEEDAELIKNGKGLVQKELVTINNAEDEVIFNIFKVPFDTSGELPSVLTVGVDITDQKKFQKQIHYMALHDELTKLPNRQLLKVKINKSLIKTSKDNKHSAVLFIDLDFFKNINDSLGHAAGDKLLKVVCRRLKAIATSHDMVARIGGDEFILNINYISTDVQKSVEYTSKIANQVITSLSEKILIDQQELYISASIGVVIYPKDANSYDQIMQRADIAMYEAKFKGRNNFVLFEAHMEKEILERHILIADLRKAIVNSEFFIEYQPQIYGNNQKVIGFEALIRWNHPSGKKIGPEDFIPAAEDSGLIISIGNWVLEQVCMQMYKWMQIYKNIPFITVNLSVLQIHNKDLVEYIHHLLSKYSVPAHLLELEVTETVMVKQINKTIYTLSQLKNLGVRLSIDDFGTGYSSLSYLKKLPFDKLKIDYSFVKDILIDKENKTLVKTIIGMTQDLGLEVIAEGVETLGQLEMLTKMGCHNFQGYYFDSAKPVKYIEEKYLK